MACRFFAAEETVIAESVSLGVSMSVVRRLKAESIGRKKMELGLGIHGEPGARSEGVAPAGKVVELLMEGLEKGRLAKGLKQPEGEICMINNLGARDSRRRFKQDSMDFTRPFHQQRTDIKGALQIEFARGPGVVNAVEIGMGKSDAGGVVSLDE